jgi:phosphatidylcholine synthase
MRTLFAWCVHLYTALGLVIAAIIATLLFRGDDPAFRLAFLFMLIATVIDATDGWFARKADVSKRTPGFDGRRLDDLIDFNTYTTLPLLLIWRANILAPEWHWVLLVPLLASAYGFSQVEAKTADDYFLGFPSYWNIVAFYLYLLGLAQWLTVAILVGLALLTFVPSRYLYPTKGSRFRLLTIVLAAAWVVTLLIILAQWQHAPQWLVWASVAFPAYYLVLSWTISIGQFQELLRTRRVVTRRASSQK